MKRKERLTVERTETDGTAGSPAPGPSDAPVPQDVPPPRYDACMRDVSGLLDGMPRQREASATMPVGPPVAPLTVEPPQVRPRPWRLLPTPTGTPFTFGYGVVLAVTSLVTEYADPAVVHDLHQASSTDVAHLVQTPVPVLLTSALWIAGGILSPFAIGFLLVLTALERRIGGLRTAGVFLLGHVLATLATEVPVGLAVLVGHLPDSSLHRLDYGVSFGVAAGVGALAGLLTPWLRWPLLAVFGAMLMQSLLAFTDPMTDWGHLTAFAIGIGTWPVVRRWYRARLATNRLPGVA